MNLRKTAGLISKEAPVRIPDEFTGGIAYGSPGSITKTFLYNL